MKHSPTQAQKDAAERRRKKFRDLVSKVAAMTDEQREEWAERFSIATCEGHVLSPTNQILVGMQCETATLVGGFNQWKRAGRAVKRGEKGIAIWIPTADKKPAPDAAGREGEGKDEGDSVRFLMGTVFDVSQTEAQTQ